MKTLHRLIALSLMFALVGLATAGDPAAALNAQIDAAAGLGDKVKVFAKASLVEVCLDKVLVKETAVQNARKVSLAAIKKIDEQWQGAEDELPIQQQMQSNACAKHLIQIVKESPAIVEVFVMDDQGAVVGENQLTSDYWQGDESKWKNSFNDGKGGIDVGKLRLDRSSGAELQQVSLPLFDADGKVIGAITFGLAIARI